MHKTFSVFMHAWYHLAEHVGDVLHLRYVRCVHLTCQLRDGPAILPLRMGKHVLVNLAKVEQHAEHVLLDIQFQRLQKQRHVWYHRKSVVIKIHGPVSNLDNTSLERGEDAPSLYLVRRDGFTIQIEVVRHLFQCLVTFVHDLHDLHEVAREQSPVFGDLHVGKLVLVYVGKPDYVDEVDGVSDTLLKGNVL